VESRPAHRSTFTYFERGAFALPTWTRQIIYVGLFRALGTPLDRQPAVGRVDRRDRQQRGLRLRRRWTPVRGGNHIPVVSENPGPAGPASEPEKESAQM